MRILFVLMLVFLTGCAGNGVIKSSDSNVVKLRPKNFLEGEMSHHKWNGVYNTASNSNIFITTISGDKKATLGAAIDTANSCKVQYMFVDSRGYRPERKKIANLTRKLKYSSFVWVEGVRFSAIGFSRVYNQSMNECAKLSIM